eukprot:6179474-Pleurochrysis_carterae.AAC.2
MSAVWRATMCTVWRAIMCAVLRVAVYAVLRIAVCTFLRAAVHANLCTAMHAVLRAVLCARRISALARFVSQQRRAGQLWSRQSPHHRLQQLDNGRVQNWVAEQRDGGRACADKSGGEGACTKRQRHVLTLSKAALRSEHWQFGTLDTSRVVAMKRSEATTDNHQMGAKFDDSTARNVSS